MRVIAHSILQTAFVKQFSTRISFIVRGLGNEESFCSCSHGAGRIMSRTQAKKQVSLDEHLKATQGVECRKDTDVIDETPSAYKPIEKVMAAQDELCIL